MDYCTAVRPVSPLFDASKHVLLVAASFDRGVFWTSGVSWRLRCGHLSVTVMLEVEATLLPACLSDEITKQLHI